MKDFPVTVGLDLVDCDVNMTLKFGSRINPEHWQDNSQTQSLDWMIWVPVFERQQQWKYRFMFLFYVRMT